MKKPGKKKLISAAVALSLVLTAGIGTYSKYVRTIKSEDNTVKAKSFVIDTHGTLDENSKFTFDAAPGESGEYNFVLDKSKVDPSLPVRYTVSFITDGDDANSLFNGSSPVDLNLYRYIQSTSYTDTNTTIGTCPELVKKTGNKLQWDVYPKGYAGDENHDYYKLDWKWNENDATDINYQGKTGKVTIQVTARQMSETLMKSSVSYTSKWNKDESYDSNSKQVLLRKDGSTRTIVVKDFLRGCDFSFVVNKTANGKLTAQSITMGAMDFKDVTFDIDDWGSSLNLVAADGSKKIYISGDYDTIQNWLK